MLQNVNRGAARSAATGGARCARVRLARARPRAWPKGWCRKGAAHYALNDFGAAVEAYEAALKLTPTDSGIQAALADAQAAGERKKREALMMPTSWSGARRKQAGAAMLAEKRYADAAAEYRSALAAMEELAGQQGARSLSAPLQQTLTSVRRGMEEQLVEATKKEHGARGGGEAVGAN